jgi:hypothetical protein
MSSNTTYTKPIIGNDEELERKYLSDLDSCLLELTVKPGATLRKVVSHARGAFPSLVITRLKQLGLYGVLLDKDDCMSESARSVILPELHPLDFEWYYTASCSATLAKILTRYVGDVLCLGAPTVAVSIARLGRKVYLADRNPLLDKRFPGKNHYLKLMLWDLYEPLPLGRSFPIVFFDAPWYLESIELWLWQASRVLERNGLIAFSIFPSLLRPTAEYERHHVLDKARRLGKVEITSDVLEYETPLFEYEALASCGINLRANWRHADLVLLRVIDTAIDTAVTLHTVDNDEWDSFVIDGQVVKLRNPTRGEPGTILEPLDDCLNYIYPTVSLRDPSRSQVDLWTSRNRVARVGQRSVVLDVLRHLADEGLPVERITDVPILSLISSPEKDLFVSRLRLILASPPEETNVPRDDST